MTDTTRPRVGLVSCYFTLFDDQMPTGFRQEREAVYRCYVDLLGVVFDVVDAGMLDLRCRRRPGEPDSP